MSPTSTRKNVSQALKAISTLLNVWRKKPTPRQAMAKHGIKDQGIIVTYTTVQVSGAAVEGFVWTLETLGLNQRRSQKDSSLDCAGNSLLWTGALNPGRSQYRESTLAEDHTKHTYIIYSVDFFFNAVLSYVDQCDALRGHDLKCLSFLNVFVFHVFLNFKRENLFQYLL